MTVRHKLADVIVQVLDPDALGPVAQETALAVADAVLGMVLPLEWGTAHDNGSGGLCIVAYGKPYMGRYNIEWWPDRVLLMVAGGEWVEYPTKTEAKAAANCHHLAQILAALGITQETAE